MSPGLLRLVCREWREGVDRATSTLTPEVCHARLIVERFPNLACLDLSEAAATVSDEALHELSSLAKLTQLNLQGCGKVNIPSLLHRRLGHHTHVSTWRPQGTLGLGQ